MDFHKVWIAQCEAARSIRESFGTRKALGYLVGEKLLNFAREAQRSPQFEAELPAFAAAVRAIFTPAQLRRYLAGVDRVGVFGHVVSDEQCEQCEFIRASGMVEDDAVAGAEDVLLLARVSELLLPH